MLLLECVVPLHNSTHVFAVTFVLFCTLYLLYVLSVFKQLHTSVPLPCATDDDICIATETLFNGLRN